MMQVTWYAKGGKHLIHPLMRGGLTRSLIFIKVSWNLWFLVCLQLPFAFPWHLSFYSVKSSVSLQTFLQNTRLSSTKNCLITRHKRSLQGPLLLIWSIYNMKRPMNLQSHMIHRRGILLLALHHIHTRGILLLTLHQQIFLRSPLLIDQKWEWKSHLPWRFQLLLWIWWTRWVVCLILYLWFRFYCKMLVNTEQSFFPALQ